MKTLLKVCMILGVLPGSLVMSNSAQAIEKPKYEVVSSAEFQGKSIEIREYAPYIVAETVVESNSLRAASSDGFRILANYIFGGNRSRESMDMTAPVQSVKMDMTAPVGTISEAGKYTISFVMPSQYTMETLPVPNDDRVMIRMVPAKRVAALVFSGFWKQSRFARHTEVLEAYLASEKIPAQSLPMVARYNMPLTPWFLRTNEILIDIPRP
ncbi:MAG: heme-binding protein [Bdellovibrionales bacterium]|nr:heme-binding protein [Bdellovibrionales bacterium]